MKRSSVCAVVCEAMESRTLFSASPTTIQTDVTTLATDSRTLRQVLSAAVSDLTSSLPADTPGLAHLGKLLDNFSNTSHTYGATINSDLATVLADQGMSAESGALATLDTDVLTARAALKPIWIKIVAAVAKHESKFESLDTHLGGDYGIVISDWTTVKASFKTLKTDLT